MVLLLGLLWAAIQEFIQLPSRTVVEAWLLLDLLLCLLGIERDLRRRLIDLLILSEDLGRLLVPFPRLIQRNLTFRLLRRRQLNFRFAHLHLIHRL